MNTKMIGNLDLATATEAQMLTWFNANSGQKPIKAFRDSKSAKQRTTELYNAVVELNAGASKPTKAKKPTAPAFDKQATIQEILRHMKLKGSELASTTKALGRMGQAELENELESWTGKPTPKAIAPAPAKAKSTPAPVVPVVITLAPPAPAPAPVVITLPVAPASIMPAPAPLPAIPRSVPAPAEIELKKEDVTKPGKRYVSKTDPDSKYHLRDRSTAEKPVSIVRRICAANAQLERKVIIQMCLAEGVNKNTAATQYSLYHAKLKQDAELAALRAAAGAGEEGEGEE